MTPLWKIQKFSGKFFFYFGGGWKKDPPPLEILGFLRHFGQRTAPTHKPQS